MEDLFSIDRMIPRLRARNKQGVLRKLAMGIGRDTDLPRSAVLDAVMQTADLPSFGPGAGVALPHALMPGVRAPLAIVATLESPVAFGAIDGSPTDLVAMLLSPSDRPSDHLRALACIARRLREPYVRDLLRACECRESMYVILLGSERQTVTSRQESKGELASRRRLFARGKLSNGNNDDTACNPAWPPARSQADGC
jgi:PTS system nitrogen regulatory IIA component